MTQRRFLLACALLASTALGAACSREHLSPNYGQAYAAWFSAQHVEVATANAERATHVVESLDAQEAAMISRSYRHNASKGDDSGQGGQMLLVAPNRGGGDVGYIPPPSVPQGQ